MEGRTLVEVVGTGVARVVVASFAPEHPVLVVVEGLDVGTGATVLGSCSMSPLLLRLLKSWLHGLLCTRLRLLLLHLELWSGHSL